MNFGKIFKAYYKHSHSRESIEAFYDGHNKVSDLKHAQLLHICKTLYPLSYIHVIPSNYMRLRHEDLVKVTYAAMKKLCDVKR